MRVDFSTRWNTKIELYRKLKRGKIERNRYKPVIKECRHTVREAKKQNEIIWLGDSKEIKVSINTSKRKNKTEKNTESKNIE